MTPAQAAGVDSRCWEMSDMVAMVEEWRALMRFSRAAKIAIWASVGFLAVGAYTVIPHMQAEGWHTDRPGIWIGTFIGAGIAGAVVGGIIGFFVTRKSN